MNPAPLCLLPNPSQSVLEALWKLTALLLDQGVFIARLVFSNNNPLDSIMVLQRGGQCTEPHLVTMLMSLNAML